MYANLTDAVAREHRSDLRREAAAVRAARRAADGRRARSTRNAENHSVATAARSLGRSFVSFERWLVSAELRHS